MIKSKIHLLFVLLCASLSTFAQVSSFQVSSPEEQGISSESINVFITSLEKNIHTVHSFVMLRHGKLVAEGWWNPYKSENPHTLWSLSKSFTSAGVGFAVQEKLLSINDRVISFFPNDLPKDPSDNLKNMRIKDLLTMSTGQRRDALPAMINPADNNPVKAFLALPVEQKPGTLFIYNTGATYMLSAIIQKVAGQKLVDYLKPRLFDPLDIKNPQWAEGSGINWGGYGLAISTEAIAKFGQLYLQKGIWNGKRLLAEDWINQSSAKQVSNGSDPLGHWDSGYGFQFWRNPKYGYRADGAFGQFCFILPEFDMVIAMTSGTSDTKGIMDIVSDNFLPILNKEKLSEEPAAWTRLKNKLASLSIPPAAGNISSPIAKKVLRKTYQLDNIEFGPKAVTFSSNKKINTIVFQTQNGSEKIISETGKWRTAETSLHPTLASFTDTKQKLSSSSAWISEDTLELDLLYIETEVMIKLFFKFEADKVSISGDRNVNFGATKLPVIKGIVKNK